MDDSDHLKRTSYPVWPAASCPALCPTAVSGHGDVPVPLWLDTVAATVASTVEGCRDSAVPKGPCDVCRNV